MLVIDPEECIDCGVCDPECPAEAIVPDSDPMADAWTEFNARFSLLWPNITIARTPPGDAAKFDGVKNKLRDHFSEKPGDGDE